MWFNAWNCTQQTNACTAWACCSKLVHALHCLAAANWCVHCTDLLWAYFWENKSEITYIYGLRRPFETKILYKKSQKSPKAPKSGGRKFYRFKIKGQAIKKIKFLPWTRLDTFFIAKNVPKYLVLFGLPLQKIKISLE